MAQYYQRSAKPLFPGSNPGGASKLKTPKSSNINGFGVFLCLETAIHDNVLFEIIRNYAPLFAILVSVIVSNMVSK